MGSMELTEVVFISFLFSREHSLSCSATAMDEIRFRAKAWGLRVEGLRVLELLRRHDDKRATGRVSLSRQKLVPLRARAHACMHARVVVSEWVCVRMRLCECECLCARVW